MSANSSDDVNAAPGTFAASGQTSGRANAVDISPAPWGCFAAVVCVFVALGYVAYWLSVPYEFRAIRSNKLWFERAAADVIVGRPLPKEIRDVCPFVAGQLLRIRVIDGVCEQTQNKAVLFVFTETLSVNDPYVVFVPTGDLDCWKWVKKFDTDHIGNPPEKVADGFWFFRAEPGFADSEPKTH